MSSGYILAHFIIRNLPVHKSSMIVTKIQLKTKACKHILHLFHFTNISFSQSPQHLTLLDLNVLCILPSNWTRADHVALILPVPSESLRSAPMDLMFEQFDALLLEFALAKSAVSFILMSTSILSNKRFTPRIESSCRHNISNSCRRRRVTRF